MLWKRKLGMWWRLNRADGNNLMKQCVSEQVKQSLPWIVEINDIATRLKVDLTEAKKISKDQWKRQVKEKIQVIAKQEIEMEIAKLKGYNENISDKIITGQKKRYIALSQKESEYLAPNESQYH